MAWNWDYDLKKPNKGQIKSAAQQMLGQNFVLESQLHLNLNQWTITKTEGERL